MTDLELGRWFHAQLEKLIAEPNHPDDDAHDRAVGKALRMAIQERAPEAGVTVYNAWAQEAGYAPVTFLGIVDGKVRANIVTAMIDIDDQYRVSRCEEASCQP